MNIWKLTLVPVAAGLALLSQGCLATKKDVQARIAPVQTQVNTVQKETADNKQAIGDLDRQVAGVDEKAAEAGRRAQEAADTAGHATELAQDARQRADGARSAASRVDSRLDQTVANLDNYQLLNTEKVYFDFGKSVLGKDEQARLDETIGTLSSAKNYVVEVEGYADRTGNRDYNVALSQQRADAVLRYLAVHNVPPRKIHVVAIGSEDPGAENKTREQRKENRRVDVRVYALNLPGGGDQATGAGDHTASASPQP